MNNTKFDCSLNDATNLRKLILDNPDLPLLFFCGEDAWTGEYSYELADASAGSIQELTLYKDHWLEKDDYEEELANDLSDEEKFINMSNDEFDKMIRQMVEATEFVTAIVVHIG